MTNLFGFPPKGIFTNCKFKLKLNVAQKKLAEMPTQKKYCIHLHT